MASPPVSRPTGGGNRSFRRFTVDEYHRMIETGILTEDDAVELLEGDVVLKMAHNPPHDAAIQLVAAALNATIPVGWTSRIQSAITLADSEPEPDVVIARGSLRTYVARHPGPVDLGLVVEVADSTLATDRTDKARIYARAGVVVYWIVNLPDRRVEVFTQPSGPAPAPAFARCDHFAPGADLLLVLDGATVATLPVAELLP